MSCFGHNPYRHDGAGWLPWLLVLIPLVAIGVIACHRDAPAKHDPVPAAATPAQHGQQLAAEESAPAPTSVKQADADLASARQLAADLRHDLKDADAHVAELETQREQLVVDVARARLAWTAGLLQLAVIGFGAFAFFSPVGRTWLVYAAVGAEVAAVLALALRLVYAWLPIAGCVVGAAFVAIAIWKVVKLARAARAAADHGERLEQALLAVPESIAGSRDAAKQLLAAVKAESIRKQDAASVRGWVAALRGKPVTPAAPAAVPA